MNGLTEQQQAEIGRILSKFSLSGIAFLDVEGRFTWVNDQWLKIFDGQMPSDFIGKSFAEITVAEDRAKDLENAKLVKEGKITSYTMEKTYTFPNGNELRAILLVARMPQSLSQDFVFYISQVLPLEMDRELEIEELKQKILTDMQSKSSTLRGSGGFEKILDFLMKYGLYLAGAGAVIAGVLNEFFALGFW